MCLGCNKPVLKDYFATNPKCKECAQLRGGISRPQCLRIQASLKQLPQTMILGPRFALSDAWNITSWDNMLNALF